MKKYEVFIVLLCLSMVLLCYSCNQSDIPIADFEGSDYGTWITEGEAFGKSPIKLDSGNYQKTPQIQRFINLNKDKLSLIKKGFVNTSVNSPQSIGKLTSPKIKVQRRYLVFLYTSGEFPGKVGVNILQEEKMIKAITGTGASGLEWHYFDLNDLIGKEIQIQLIDQVAERRATLQADHFYFSNNLPVVDKSIEIKLKAKYLNLPVRTGDPVKQVRLVIDNKIVDEFTIELADSIPQFYVFIDVERFLNKDAVISAKAIEKKSKGFDLITNDNYIKGGENIYKERLRQQIHFSVQRGWNNDPNGLVYYAGEYHLYYQHNPYGWNWGNMHWGHAISTDLIHWKELPEAINPYRFGDWAFSGSAIMDIDNTSGFKQGGESVMVAAYTSTGRGEAIAFSNDKGRTFTEYSENPVIKHKGRDPKLIWYAPGKHWVMALYHEEDGKRWIAFYTSENLKDWTYQSKIDGFFECPEIFELKVDENPAKSKWVVYSGDGSYVVGSFDGKEFKKESSKYPNNYGNCFYASQTYNNIPQDDGRRIQIGWGKVNTPLMAFNQCMLFPTQLTLRTTDEGITMFTEPIKEVVLLHKNEWKKENLVIEPNSNPISGINGELFHIKGDFKVGKKSQVGFKIHGTEVIFDAEKAELVFLDRRIKCKPEFGKVFFEIIVDRNTIEIFINHGRIYVPIARDLTKDYGLELICRNEKVTAENLQIFELKSIWE
jgi:fructan beta-fructosidase